MVSEPLNGAKALKHLKQSFITFKIEITSYLNITSANLHTFLLRKEKTHHE